MQLVDDSPWSDQRRQVRGAARRGARAPSAAAAHATSRAHDVHRDGAAVEHDPLRPPRLLGPLAAHRLRGRGPQYPDVIEVCYRDAPSRPRRCRASAASATTASTTATSSGRSSASRARSRATATARSCSPRSSSAARTTRSVDARGERADVEYLRILHLAASTMQSDVETALERLLARGERPDFITVKALAAPDKPTVPVVHIPPPDLAVYDASRGGASMTDFTLDMGTRLRELLRALQAAHASRSRWSAASPTLGTTAALPTLLRGPRARGRRARTAPHRQAPQGLAPATGQDARHPRPRQRSRAPSSRSSTSSRPARSSTAATTSSASGCPAAARPTLPLRLGHALVQPRAPVLFTPTFRLVQELLAAKRDLGCPARCSASTPSSCHPRRHRLRPAERRRGRGALHLPRRALRAPLASSSPATSSSASGTGSSRTR